MKRDFIWENKSKKTQEKKSSSVFFLLSVKNIHNNRYTKLIIKQNSMS